jgi:hypothetical protein
VILAFSRLLSVPRSRSISSFKHGTFPERSPWILSGISFPLQNLPRDATNKFRLALYDVVIYIDDSGSMAFEEQGERIKDLELIMQRVAFAATLFDEDGYVVHESIAKACKFLTCDTASIFAS